MVRIEVNGRQLEVEAGTTLLEAARSVGVEIPTLCHRDGLPHFTSCMLCVVREARSGNLLPSCSTRAVDGMVIETHSDEVLESRRSCLELLLAEHGGDCEAPCRRTCPAAMDAARMCRLVATGEHAAAAQMVHEQLVLPATLGCICPAPCEGGCRRRQLDEPIAIRDMHRRLAEDALAGGGPQRPEPAAPSGRRIAIVGAGPAGLAAAHDLLLLGHGCVLFDELDQAGGMLRVHLVGERLPARVLDAEVAFIRALGAELELGTRVGRDVTWEGLRQDFDAVLLATGAERAEAAEAFGLETTKRGLRVDASSHATGCRGVFAGGGVVRPGRLAVRAVAHGRAMAVAAHQLLEGREPGGPVPRFDSKVARPTRAEVEAVAAAAVLAPQGAQDATHDAEAGRCLSCACLAADSCLLRSHAEAHGATQECLAGGEPGRLGPPQALGEVLLETGKCIRCGLCLRLCEAHGEPIGLTFLGRGSNVRVGVPIGRDPARALERTAALCVEACPTGALAFRPGAGELGETATGRSS